MKTTRLDYDDAYCTDFTATLVGITTLDGRPTAQLDQSYFYPTSGGQPHDTGLLGDRRVVDVVVDEEGVVHHLLDAAPSTNVIGQPIRGLIDWARRYDHMQQHTAQHLLSQVFHRLCGYDTLSVHFGDTVSTVDLDAKKLTAVEMIAIEDEVNRQIYANLPVRTYFVRDDELDRVPLRKRPAVSGKIRIVEIEQYDYSACGGTHVRATGELGMVRLIRQERSRGHVRVTFLCGGRALRHYREATTLLNDAAAQFSTDPAQVPALIARSQAQLKALQRRVDDLTAQSLAYEADQLYATAQEVAGHRVIAQMMADKDAGALKSLANLLQAKPNAISLLVCPAGEKLTVIFARGADVVTPMGDLLRTVLGECGGGGGGRPEFAQGGGVPVSGAHALLDFATNTLVAQLRR